MNDKGPTITKKRLFWWYWFPVLVYSAAVFVQSAFPSPDSLNSLPLSDKMLHFLAYAVMGGLFFRALEKTRPHRHAFRNVLWGVLLTTLYGVSDEVHQSFVAARMAEKMDVVADFAGGIFGVLCFCLLLSLVRRTGRGLLD